MPVAQVRNAKWPADAVEFIGAAFVVLGFAEVGQDVVEAPTRISELSPMIEVIRLSADVDQSVDRTGAADNLAARGDDVAVVAIGLRFGLVAPIVTLIGEQPAEAERNVKPRVPVVGACLQQEHAVVARCSQPIGQNAPSTAGS